MPEPTNDGQGGGTSNEDDIKDQGGQGGAGEGEGGTPQTIKVGDKEYTPDQLKDFEKKASDYDSLLPEFTKKSQRLSELENKTKSNDTKQDDPAPYDDPNWQPESYADLAKAIKMAEERGQKRTLEKLQEMESKREEAKNQVDNFIGGIKAKDKTFNEDDFYQFATKHKFPINTIQDLNAVYSAYADLHTTVKATEERLKGEKEKRGKDTVAGNKGGTGAGFSTPYAKIRSAGSAVDAVRDALQGSK